MSVIEDKVVLTEEELAKVKKVSSVVSGIGHELDKVSLLPELLEVRDFMIDVGFKSLEIECSEEYDDNTYFMQYSFGSFVMMDVPKEDILKFISNTREDFDVDVDWLDETGAETLDDAMRWLCDEDYYLDDISSEYDLKGVFRFIEILTVEELDEIISGILNNDIPLILKLGSELQEADC